MNDDKDYYTWQIESRYRIQHLLLDLYTFLKDKQSVLEQEKLERSLFAHLVGAAFSLWRAAFLVGSDRGWPNVLEKAKLFLEWVLQDNAITFSRDRDASNWTVGYYLNNARYRVARMSSNVADHATYCRLTSTEAFQALQDILKSGGIDERDPKEVWNQLYKGLWAAFEMLRGAEVLNKAQEP